MKMLAAGAPGGASWSIRFVSDSGTADQETWFRAEGGERGRAEHNRQRRPGQLAHSVLAAGATESQ